MIVRKAQKGLGRKYIFIHAKCAFNVAVNRGRATYIRSSLLLSPGT